MSNNIERPWYELLLLESLEEVTEQELQEWWQQQNDDDDWIDENG